MKKKITPEQKYKLIYSGELAIVAVIAIVLGILFLLEILGRRDHTPIAYTVLTLTGAAWILFDFFWTTFSKERKAKKSYLDRILNLPLAIGLIIFDVYAIVNGLSQPQYPSKFISIFMFYIALNTLFQAIYHYYKPIPEIIEMIEQDKIENQENIVNNEDNKGDDL